jgi:hypothetical protein
MDHVNGYLGPGARVDTNTRCSGVCSELVNNEKSEHDLCKVFGQSAPENCVVLKFLMLDPPVFKLSFRHFLAWYLLAHLCWVCEIWKSLNDFFQDWN